MIQRRRSPWWLRYDHSACDDVGPQGLRLALRLDHPLLGAGEACTRQLLRLGGDQNGARLSVLLEPGSSVYRVPGDDVVLVK